MQGFCKTRTLSINICIAIEIMEIIMTKVNDIELVQRSSAKKNLVYQFFYSKPSL